MDDPGTNTSYIVETLKRHLWQNTFSFFYDSYKSSIHVQFFEISQVNFKFIILGKYIDGNVVEIS